MTIENFMNKFTNATPEERWDLLSEYLKSTLREILVYEEDEELTNEMHFQDIGLDSFTAVRLRNAILDVFGQELKIESTDIFDHGSVNELCKLLASKLPMEIKVKI